jgi:hypothetical protein
MRIKNTVATAIATDATIKRISLFELSMLPSVGAVGLDEFVDIELQNSRSSKPALKNLPHRMSSSESLVDYLGLKMGKLDHPDLKYLWVGSKADASNLEALVANNIHFVVNCTPDHLEGGVKNFHETQRGFRYFRVPIRDVKSEVCFGISLYVMHF